MGFAGSADIFQMELRNLMAALEYVRAYIDNLLVITKSSHDDHLGKVEHVFIQLHNARLKINAAKSFFCAQETEYLGYILTLGGVGTLKDGYIHKVPLLRAPRGQHANHVTTKLHDTCYLPQVPRIPTWSDLTRSLAGLGRKTLLPFSLALM
jgi:hypothetical protein